ncbi:MAG: hypothetical protein KDK25_00570 [Leptospiraceae bacterium]|nr:hypothetical protein [Leptospiraceae bacterium]
MKGESRNQKSPELSQKRLQYIERMGIFFEREGLPRMAGRVFALLLTDEKDILSTANILELLHASRGSVSTMTRFLMHRGMIEKTGRPGERQDYFRIKADALNTMFSERLKIVHEFKSVIREGLQYAKPGSASYDMIRELEGFYDWFEKRLPELWKEWEEERNSRGL